MRGNGERRDQKQVSNSRNSYGNIKEEGKRTGSGGVELVEENYSETRTMKEVVKSHSDESTIGKVVVNEPLQSSGVCTSISKIATRGRMKVVDKPLSATGHGSSSDRFSSQARLFALLALT